MKISLVFKKINKALLVIILFSILLISFFRGCAYFERAGIENEVILGADIYLKESGEFAKNIVLLVPYPYFKGKPWLKAKGYLYKNMEYQYKFDPLSKEWRENINKWQKATPKDVKLSRVKNKYGTFLKIEIPDLLSKERTQREKIKNVDGINFYTRWTIRPAMFIPDETREEWPYLDPTFESKEEATRIVEKAIDYIRQTTGRGQKIGNNISLAYVSYEGSPISFGYSFSVDQGGGIRHPPLPKMTEGIGLTRRGEELKSNNWYIVNLFGNYVNLFGRYDL